MKTILLLALSLVACGPVESGSHYTNSYPGGETPHAVMPPEVIDTDGGPATETEGLKCTKTSDCPWDQVCFSEGMGRPTACSFKGQEGYVGCRPQPQFSDCGPGLYCQDVNGNPDTDTWGICTLKP